MDDLVIAALQEGGVDGAEGAQALTRQPRCKCYRMLLRDADVERAVVEPVKKTPSALTPVQIWAGTCQPGVRCSSLDQILFRANMVCSAVLCVT